MQRKVALKVAQLNAETEKSLAEAEASIPVENRKYTRGSLFSALRETVAEKGMAAIAKRKPPNLGG